jgi:hypothetical protein
MAVKSLKRSSVKSTQKNNTINAGYSFQDFELIESIFLSANATSIIFNNLNQYATDYKHLQIRVTARTSRADTGDTIRVQFNQDTASNYRSHHLAAAGTTVSSFAQPQNTSFEIYRIAGGNDAGSAFGVAIIDILDSFSSSKNKITRALSGSSATYREVVLNSGLWINTSPITSISFIGGNGSFVSGSRFSIYGIR